MKKSVLFLCTHNSARSQMAEALLRDQGGDEFEVYSAGTEATRVHPMAIAAMRELGIDISRQQSKVLDEFLDRPFDFVITVCDRANENCPTFPLAKERFHWGFEDPTQVTGSDLERMQAFRKVRDAIANRLRFFQNLSVVRR